MVTPNVTKSACAMSRLALQTSMEQHPLIEYASRTGRTTTAIAKAASCSRMTLYRLIKGEQNATIDLLKRVSAATNGEVSLEALLPEPPTPSDRSAA